MKMPSTRVLSDEALYYDDWVLVTKDSAWTAVEVPLVPYGFRARADRLAIGLAATQALAGLRSGDVRIKVVRRPFNPSEWMSRMEHFGSDPSTRGPHWHEWLIAQAERMMQAQTSTKHVYLLVRLGTRKTPAQWNSRLAKGPVPAVAAAEVSQWTTKAAVVRDSLARSLDAVGVDAPDLRWLRQHSLLRGLDPQRDSATKRRVWGRGDLADEFSGITLSPTIRGVRVDGATGTRYVATLVASAFPEEAWHPESPPWLAHLDYLGDWAEADVPFTLVPPRKAKGDVMKRYRLAQDQHAEAQQAGATLPIETERMHNLARNMEDVIPSRRMPLAYGWARITVNATSEEQLAARVREVIERYAEEDSPRIDWTLPTGMAQIDLLTESIPGMPVRHKSYQRRWMVETVACSLPHAGSNLGHNMGLYVGPTTGRHVQAVTLDLHHSITRRTARDVEGPGGLVLLGAQRAGKSSALGTITSDAIERGVPTVLMDFSGPLARLADLPRHAGRVEVLDLTKAGGGLLDPMSNHVIPGDGPAARIERQRLTRDVLTTLAWRTLQDDEAEHALLRAIVEESDAERPSLAGIVRRLETGPMVAQALAERLRFDLTGTDGDLLLGDSPTRLGWSGMRLDVGDVVARIITAPGLALPRADTPREQWMPAQAVGAAVFTIAAHLAHRLLWDLDPHTLKLLLVDEAHVAMGTEAGRRVIEQSLRDGPKHGVVVGLATHNARDLSDERITNAVATKMLFRSTAEPELEAAIRVAGLEDTLATRLQIKGLRNGECVMVTDTDVRDRVRWDLHDPELAEALRTTPAGR